MSTTKGFTTVPVNEEGAAVPASNGPPMKCRRKMKKFCCCLTFLLVLNVLLTMHIAKEICYIAHLFYDNDVVLMPGGQQSFCNDFCADLCINDAQTFSCNVVSCLNNCNQHFGVNDIMYSQPAVAIDDDEVPPPPPRQDGDDDVPPPPPADGPQVDGVPPPPPKDDRQP